MVHETLVPDIPGGTYGIAEVPADRDIAYGSETGPFIAIDTYKGDRVYLNAVTAGEIASAFGWLEPAAANALRAALDEIAHERDLLREELDAERLDKVVPLAEVIDFVKAKANRRPEPVSVA